MTQKDEKEKVVQEEKKKKSIHDTSFVCFTKDFLKTLIHEKLFLLSFILTLFFLGLFFNDVTKGSEGYFQKIDEHFTKTDNTVEATVDVDLNKDNKDMDVSSLIGIYSREVALNESIQVGDSCSISSYKLIYKISENKSIFKYLDSECLGTIRIWNDTLKYNTSNSARYISANGINYLFSNTGIKEVDGETYRLDDSISTIKEENKLNGAQISFIDNNIVIMSNKRLIILKGNNIVLDTNKDYVSNGGSIERKIFKSKSDTKYSFIVFNNAESLNCYQIFEEENDNELYKIYSITYNAEKKSFDDVELKVERKINDGCSNWNEDYNLLQQ